MDEWQYTSVEFRKTRREEVSHIRVWCEYWGQLVCIGTETGLTDADFSGSSDSSSNSNSSDTDTESSMADEIANTETDTASDFPTFEEARDMFGNLLTETTYQDTEFGTVYRSFGYDADGNDLTRETDARGNETTYVVDEDTSRKEEVTDREGNKTRYEYDSVGRTTRVASCDAEGTELGYTAYEYDTMGDLTGISRGDGQNYYMTYNYFRRLESIGIGAKSATRLKVFAGAEHTHAAQKPEAIEI